MKTILLNKDQIEVLEPKSAVQGIDYWTDELSDMSKGAKSCSLATLDRDGKDVIFSCQAARYLFRYRSRAPQR